MNEGLVRSRPLRGNWYTGIAAQILALGSVPLIFLIAVLLLALAIQRNEAENFARARVSTQIVAQSDRIYDILDRQSQAILRYEKTRSPKDAANVHALSRSLPPAISHLGTLVTASGKQRPLFEKYRKLTLNVAGILNVYYTLQLREGRQAATKYASSPAIAKVLRSWRDTKTAFDRNETDFAIQTYASSRHQLLPFQRLALALSVAGAFLTVAFFLLFGIRIVRRLQRVAYNAEELLRGNDPVPVGGDDEIGRLDHYYRDTTIRLRQSQRVASTLQRALLPQSLPRINGLHVHTAYVSAERESAVGGDWYDLFRIDDGIVGISAGDVAGHGIAAATLMAAVRQSVRSAARASEDPAIVLDHVNRVLCSDEEGALVSAIFATFDVRSGHLHYAIAGHPAPLLISPSLEARILDGNPGMLLGIDRAARFDSHEETLEPGSSMVFYSDGLIEHERTPVQGLDQLVSAAVAEARSPGSNPADGVQRRVLNGRRPHDDSAVMYLVYSHASPDEAKWRREWSFDARDEDAATRVKRALFWHLADHIEPDESVNMEIVYGELIANVARHTPGPADVEIERSGGDIILRVADQGRPFDATVPAEVDFLSESGRGMFLIASLASAFSVSRQGGGNCVSVSFPVNAKRSPLIVGAPAT
jgi:anti-sigma regulatory factor (Ser/Thr protein kinase)